MSVAVRFAVRRSDDAELGSLAMSSVAFVLTAAIGATRRLDLRDVWPFLITGTIAPGLSQVFFVRAVREAGAARTSVLMGTAPLVAVAIALVSRRGAWPRGYGRQLRLFLPAGVFFGLSYAALFEAYYRSRVSVVAPLVATESLWGVVFSVMLLRRSELVGRWLVAGAALIVAGGALIGVSR